MSDSTELRFLEGEAALRDQIHSLTGRRPNAVQTAYAASCIMHGRLYWESANAGPMETRPLLLYYGAASFAKALVIAKTGCQIGDIASGHGISCCPGVGDAVGTYKARTNGQGLFQQFNDVVADLNRVLYFEDYNTKYHYIRSAKSAAFPALSTTIEEVLSRVPDISDTYTLCVGKPASVLKLQLDAPLRTGFPYEIRVDLPESFEGRNGLISHVAMIRQRAPFLRYWRVGQATHAWNNSIVRFYNRTGALEPQEFETLVEDNDGKTFSLRDQDLMASPASDALSTLPSLTGGYGGTVAYTKEIDGNTLSEYSFLLLGLLALSSLVRYQPHVWTSCVHRRRFGERPIDDRLLPAIEAFLARATTAFPKMVSDVLLQR